MMLDTIAAWLGAERYSQHAICLTNDALMITLYTISESVTGLSYFVIGGLLLVGHAQGLVLNGTVRLLGGLFIFLCGLQHFTSLLTLYSGVYRLDIIVKVATASISAATAFSLVTSFWRGSPLLR